MQAFTWKRVHRWQSKRNIRWYTFHILPYPRSQLNIQYVFPGCWWIDPSVLSCILHFIERSPQTAGVRDGSLLYLHVRASGPVGALAFVSDLRETARKRSRLLRQWLARRSDMCDSYMVILVALTWFNLNPVSHLAHGSSR